MVRQAPRKHPDLVEVVRQPRLERTQRRHVNGDVLLVSRRPIIVHRRHYIRPHKPLVLRVACQRVRRVHIDHPCIHPARVPRRIAHQPPVLHHRRRRRHRIHLGHRTRGPRRLRNSGDLLPGIRSRRLRNRLLRLGRGRPCRRLLHRRPPQQLQLVALVQQKKVLRVAPWLHVHVHQVAHDAGGDLSLTLVLLLQLVEVVHNLVGGHHLLFDPTHLAARILHLDRVARMLQHLQPFAIVDLPGPVRHRGHPVPQKRLLRRHIDVLVRGFRVKALAPPQKGKRQSHTN